MGPPFVHIITFLTCEKSKRKLFAMEKPSDP